MFLDYIIGAEPLTFLDVIVELWVQSLVLVAMFVVAVAAAASLCNPGGYGECSATTAIVGVGAVIACGQVVDLASFGVVAMLGQGASADPGLWAMFGDTLILFGAGAMTRNNTTYRWADDSSDPLWQIVWAQSKAVTTSLSEPHRGAGDDYRAV